jgi:thiol-disulfide isomerase/thioredoxin
MKRIFSLSILVLSSFLVRAQLSGQAQVLRDTDGSKILRGIIFRETLAADSSYSWYAPSAQDYTPYKKAVESLAEHRDSLQLIVFMGTWCHDSQYVIPKFYRLMDASHIQAKQISLFGVDRDKKTLGPLADALNVVNVPTIIVMKDGKEMGRVVEYGKYGMFDKELGEIVDAAFGAEAK